MSKFGFVPRFLPKNSTGEKRKRNVSFWADLDQTGEMQANVSENLECEADRRECSIDTNTSTERSPEPKRTKGEFQQKKGSNKEPIDNEENEDINSEEENDEYSWCEDDLDIWNIYLKEAKDNGIIKKCIDCNKMYCAEYDSGAKRTCSICKLNSHGCLKDKHIKISKGFVWLCIDCKETIECNNVNATYRGIIREKTARKVMKEKYLNEKGLGQEKDVEKCEKSNKMKNCESQKINVENHKEQEARSTKLKENDVNEEKIGKSQKDKVLDYHGVTIYESDLKSLDGENWIHDSIIAFWQEYLQQVKFKDTNKLLFVTPSLTELIGNGDLADARSTILQIRTLHKHFIFFPINNNTCKDKPNGTHWSLLVFSKNLNTWYHYDSLKGTNVKHARAIMNRVNFHMGECEERVLPRPNFIEAKCSQQNNGYDCGVFTMLFTQYIAKRANDGKSLETCEVKTIESNRMRTTVRDLFSIEKHMSQKKNCHEDTKARKNESEIRVCRYWSNGTCNKGSRCWFKHPTLCESHTRTGNCETTNSCKNYHPTLCRYNIRREVCIYGSRCRFRHINQIKYDNKNVISTHLMFDNSKYQNSWKNNAQDIRQTWSNHYTEDDRNDLRKPNHEGNYEVNKQSYIERYNQNENHLKSQEMQISRRYPFLANNPKHQKMCRQLQSMMANVIEEMAEIMYIQQ